MAILSAWVGVAVVGLGLAQPALALDPARTLGQFQHTRWTPETGAPTEVRAIVQTPDGFLWLGADDGLYRFDGVAFERVPLPNPRHSHGSGINALLVTRAGRLVVGFDLGGVGIYERGRFSYLEDRRVRGTIRTLAEDAEGGLWAAVGSRRYPLARYHQGAWRIIGADWGLPAGKVMALHPGPDGTLWFGLDGWLGYLPAGERRIRAVSTAVGQGPGLAHDRKGRLWISDSLGARWLTDPRRGAVQVRSPTPVGRAAEWTHLLVDRDQNVWGGLFGDGLFRIRALDAPHDAASDSAPVETLPAESRLTGDVIWAVFEDREGDIWAGTNGGLDRFRHANVLRQPLIGSDSPRGYGLWTTRRGAVLVGDAHGLFKAEPGQALRAWFPDLVVSALCEGPDQALWAFAQRPGKGEDQLFRIEGDRRSVVAPPWSAADVVSCSVDESGGLWAVPRERPAYRWSGGTVRRYAAADAADFSSVQAFGQDGAFLVRNRNLFRADATGLSAVDYGADRFFPGSLVQLWRDPGGALVAASNGVVKLDGARSRFLSDARFGWLEDINGLARGSRQATWLRSKGGVTLIASADLDRAFVDTGFKPPVRTFGLADGLVGSSGAAIAAPVVVGGDGRAWLATTSGVFSIDPARLYRNAVPPPVVISALTVDGRRVENPTEVSLPRGARSLQIDYTALSLSLPERVAFRYRLEGVDADWVDPGRRRQAFYTNLPPGRYVFRVKAANEDGVWNETGARLDLRLPPTFVQSRVFLALGLLAALSLGWMAYRLRLQQVAGRIRTRLRERLAERERIARELHDTLLQGVQGLVLTFHAATRQVPTQSPARGRLESALARAEAVIVEARDRVRHLRGATGENLAMALAALVERVDPDQTYRIRLEANGPNRRLHPVVADEVEQLVAEALTNACRHAEASAILLRITFEARGLSVQIEDDGKGIDPGIVEAGEREGHFGLAGMRERAGKIGGVLSIRNGDAAGAVVELFVPARAAFAEQGRRWRLFGTSSIDGWLER